MKTHNESFIDTNGTCLQGYVTVSYHTLVDTFGQPHGSDGYKVDWEWDIEFPDGTVATIYNWKNGPNYGNTLTRPEDINEWHVGGNSSDAVTAINNILDECRGVRLTAAY